MTWPKHDQPGWHPDAQAPDDANKRSLPAPLTAQCVPARPGPRQAGVNPGRTTDPARPWSQSTQARARHSAGPAQDMKMFYQHRCWLPPPMPRSPQWHALPQAPFQSGHCGLQIGLPRGTACHSGQKPPRPPAQGSSGGLWRVKRQFELRYLVSKKQAPFFEAPEHDFVDGRCMCRNIYQRIEVCVFDFKFDQTPFR
ncbi:hypothetical protein D9M73_60300 [compost metagenome]